MKQAYIALGSNLGDPIAQIHQAIESIKKIPHTQIEKCSSLYRTSPWGKTDQPDFINAVVKVKTDCSPEVLLEHLQKIENNQDKKILEKWGPRTIDCDLILYENEVIEMANLVVPHPRMKTRGFVMAPLAEVEPALIFPSGESIADVLVQCDCSGIEVLC